MLKNREAFQGSRRLEVGVDGIEGGFGHVTPVDPCGFGDVAFGDALFAERDVGARRLSASDVSRKKIHAKVTRLKVTKICAACWRRGMRSSIQPAEIAERNFVVAALAIR